MSNRRIRIERLATMQEEMFIDVELYYSMGGMNFFTGRSELRGYYLGVTPTKIEKRVDGTTGRQYEIKTQTAFSGFKSCLKVAKRYSDKELNALSAGVKTDYLNSYNELLLSVLAKNNLALATETPALTSVSV